MINFDRAEKMSATSTMKTVAKSTPDLALLGVRLFWIYLTLGSRVRKARKAFEEQLILQGMSREDAERLSTCYNELKNDLTSMLRNTGFNFGRQ